MVTRYYRELLNFLARAVRDRDTAADLAQESYARLLAAQQAGLSVQDPRALLYRTARNLVIDQHRRAAVRDERGEVLSSDEVGVLDGIAGPSALEPDAILASREGLAAIMATIEALPPRCREAFILFKFDGLSYAEIAAQMGISTRTVEMQLQIAMQACWRCLDDLNGRAPAQGRKPPRSGR